MALLGCSSVTGRSSRSTDVNEVFELVGLGAMNFDDHQQIESLKAEINKDIALAISSFKVWLFATVLSNVVLIGAPALFVFFTTQTTSNDALELAKDNRSRLDARSEWINVTEARIGNIEGFLERSQKYKLIENIPARPR